MLTAKNTAWNRDLNLVEAKGNIILQKNATVYFYFEMKDGDLHYFKCDETIFAKQFEISIPTEPITMETEQLDVVLKKCKKYPF